MDNLRCSLDSNLGNVQYLLPAGKSGTLTLSFFVLFFLLVFFLGGGGLNCECKRLSECVSRLVDLTREGTVFSFFPFLSLIWMFPSKSFLFCVPFCFFIPPCLLCLVVLTSYSYLSSDYEQQRQRVKFSHFFLLIFFFCTLGICFSDHTSLSFSFIHCQS